jgi:membrane protein
MGWPDNPDRINARRQALRLFLIFLLIASMSFWRHVSARVRATGHLALLTARDMRLPEVAASLTFSSVLALVPLVAVVLSILTAFPVFTSFRDTLSRDVAGTLLPVPYAQTIVRYLTEFAAKAAGVGIIGLLFLGMSAFSMLLTVDRVLNDIWRVHRRRSLMQRLLVYWAVLSVGPVLLGLSLSLTSWVISLSDRHGEHLDLIIRHGLGILSPAIAVLAYGTVYSLVPNRRVRWRHAFTGGMVTAITGEAMSRGFAAYILHGRLFSIYGAFAAVPVFLTWIFLSWLAFLVGAVIAANAAHVGHRRLTDRHRPGDRFITAVAALRLLYNARLAGELGALTQSAMAHQLHTDEEDLSVLLHHLEETGYVRRLSPPWAERRPESESPARGKPGKAPDERDDPTSGEWVLACDPGKTTLATVYASLALDPDNSLLNRADLPLSDWLQPVLAGPWHACTLDQLTRGSAVRLTSD